MASWQGKPAASSNMNQMETTFDDVLKLVGTHGRWQWIVFFLTSFSGFFVAFHNMGAAFLAPAYEHWCYSPLFRDLHFVYNWTEAQTKSAFIPRDNSPIGHSSCQIYDVPNLTMFTGEELRNPEVMINRTQSSMFDLKPCETWAYNTTAYISTVVSQWDLVCNRKALGPTVQSSFMAGVLLGCIIFGWVSDKYGRRKAVLIALVLFIVSSLLAAWSTEYLMFIIIRFISAIGDAGVFSVAFVIITEVSGRSSRALLGLQYMVPFSLGFMVLPIIANFIRDWFWLQLAISMPALFLLSYFWFLPESPRWLVTQGRFEEAMVILKAGAGCNGQTLPVDEDLLVMLQCAQKKSMHNGAKIHKSGNFLDLLRTPIIRKRCAVLSVTWFVVGLVYYGLSFSAPNIGTSVYVFTFLAAAVEVPAFFATYPVIEKWGRKMCFVGTMLVAGVSCLAILLISKDALWLVTTFALLGKFFSTACYGLAFLYTVELFPTPIRNLSVGMGAMLSRLGSVVSPFVIDILSSYHAAIPMATFGILCLISGLISFQLPETLHKNLPETIEEIEGMPRPKEVELINMERNDQHQNA